MIFINDSVKRQILNLFYGGFNAVQTWATSYPLNCQPQRRRNAKAPLRTMHSDRTKLSKTKHVLAFGDESAQKLGLARADVYSEKVRAGKGKRNPGNKLRLIVHHVRIVVTVLRC